MAVEQVTHSFMRHRLRAIHDLPDICWEVEGTRVLASVAGPLRITYTARVTNPGLFDAAFIDAFTEPDPEADDVVTSSDRPGGL